MKFTNFTVASHGDSFARFKTLDEAKTRKREIENRFHVDIIASAENGYIEYIKEERIKYGYKHNEWTALYVEPNGEQKARFFDTVEEAKDFLDVCEIKIGIMTTAFYYNRVKGA